MPDPKQDEGFKVVDRRLFTEDGELRKDAVEQERREEEAAKARKSAPPAQSQASSSKPAAQAPAGVADGSPAAAPGAASLEAESADAIPSSRSFQVLVDFLTRNAAAMLGGMADPRTGQPFLDLEGAREMIDMLDVLREKTRGNLAKADEDLLIEVLGSLKLTFMELSKAAADAMANKATKR